VGAGGLLWSAGIFTARDTERRIRGLSDVVYGLGGIPKQKRVFEDDVGGKLHG
jgi:hypothetical protein